MPIKKLKSTDDEDEKIRLNLLNRLIQDTKIHNSITDNTADKKRTPSQRHMYKWIDKSL